MLQSSTLLEDTRPLCFIIQSPPRGLLSCYNAASGSLATGRPSKSVKSKMSTEAETIYTFCEGGHSVCSHNSDGYSGRLSWNKRRAL